MTYCTSVLFSILHPTQSATQKIYYLLKDDLSPSKVKRHFDVVSSQRQTLAQFIDKLGLREGNG